MEMMFEAIDNLLKVYKSIRPLISLGISTCQRRRVVVKGPNNRAIVRDATAGHDVKGSLFDIPLDRAPGQLLRLKDFKLEVAAPYV